MAQRARPFLDALQKLLMGTVHAPCKRFKKNRTLVGGTPRGARRAGMAEQATIERFFSSPVAHSVAAAVAAPSSAVAAPGAKVSATGATKPLAAPTAAKRTKRVKLPAARLQCVGAGQLERKIEALRSKLPQQARIVVYSFCWRLRCGSADEYAVLNESNGPAFDTFKAQTVLSYYEFMGMVIASAAIANALVAGVGGEETHVLVVDATPRADFARLAAGFAAAALRIAHNCAIQAPAPINPLFVAALAAAKACTTTAMLHYAMEAHFDAHMAYEVEPVDDGAGAAKKAKGPRKT